MSEVPKVTHAAVDVGGVLMHCRDEGKRAVASNLRLNEHQLETFWSWVTEDLGRGTTTEEDLWERTALTFGVRRVYPSEELLKMEGIVYDKEAIIRLQRLGACGIRVVLFTNTIPSHAAQLQELYAQFSAVYRSDKIGSRKPELASFQHVLAQEKVRPEATMFFDDNSDNIAAAQQVGMLAVQVRSVADIAAGIRTYVPDCSL